MVNQGPGHSVVSGESANLDETIRSLEILRDKITRLRKFDDLLVRSTPGIRHRNNLLRLFAAAEPQILPPSEEPENSAMVESCAPKRKPRRKLKRGQPNSRRKLTAVDPIDRPRTLLPTHEMSDFELHRQEWADAAMAAYGVSPDS